MREGFERVHAFMERAVGQVFPGAVIRIARSGEELFHQAYGRIAATPDAVRVTQRTQFDVASLTKPMAIGTLAMLGVDEGWLKFDAPAAEKLPLLDHEPHRAITLGDLLAHRSGLPDWRPYLEWMVERHSHLEPGTDPIREKLAQWICREPLVRGIGEEAIYSDLGYILLGWWLEAALEGPLDGLFLARVAEPLGLARTAFIPIETWESTGARQHITSIASTEQCPVRRRLLRGEVHDEHAFLLGGVSGHAGVFSTARDVGCWADALLASRRGDGFISSDTVRRFWEADGLALTGSWRYAWDTPSETGSSAGAGVSGQAVGHLGYTGCSIWIDPERETTITLVTNRVHPSRNNETIRLFRPRLHDTAWAALDSIG